MFSMLTTCRRNAMAIDMCRLLSVLLWLVKDVYDEHEGTRNKRTSLPQVFAQTSETSEPHRR